MRQDGFAAVATMLLVMFGIILVGLVMDLGLLTFARVRLDHATEAAARGAVSACHSGGAVDPTCAAQTAAFYLQANMPGAAIDSITIEPSRVTVQASALVPYAFAELWKAAPSRLESHYGVTTGT